MDNYEITTIGTISWVNGKIGKALSAGTASQTSNGVSINSNLTDILSENYSVAVWVKPLGDHVHYNGTILSSGDWNHTRWAFGLNQDNTKVDVLSNGYNIYIDCSVPINEWTHLCCVRTSDGFISLYKNGVYINHLYRSDHPLSDANNTTVGRETYANGYFSFNGNINDLRVYDHALSPREVKEISKGLVLHYTLSGSSGENIATNSADLTKWTKESGVTCTWDADKQMYKIQSTSTSSRWGIWQQVSCEPNTTYTFSVDGMKTDQDMYLSVGSSVSGGWPGNYTAFTNERKRLSHTWTTASDHTVIRMYLAMYPTTNGSKIAYYALPKLEKNSIATPWTPNSSDSEFTQMGFNDNIEYDVSGFCNNGTKLATLSYSSDTPKYNTSTYLNGTDNNVISVPFNNAINISSPFTINLWWKKTELGNDNYESLFGGPSGFEMDTRAGASSTLSLYMASTRGGSVYSPFNLNTWYMVTMASDQTNEYYYINGELVKTIEAKSMPSGNYFIGAWSNATSQNYKGYLSDFRIYSTCLSADDILELYNTPISLTSNGVLMTSGELTEA